MTVLWERVGTSRYEEPSGVPASASDAGLEYLARKIDDPSVTPEGIASSHHVELWELLATLPDLRRRSSYRSYIGEWIRAGRPAGDEPGLLEVDDFEEEWQAESSDEAVEDPLTPEPVAWDRDLPVLDAQLEEADTEHPPVEVPAPVREGSPSRWRFERPLYSWQQAALAAWERNERHGIMQVVTGAGKTLLAIHAVARLLDQQSPRLFVVVVVPRIALVEQWYRAIRTALNVQDLRIGVYHGGQKCFPAAQDILIITQDSARRIMPAMRLSRPTLLIADECHRLGAQGASRVFDNSYEWTLGLSATPERASDTAFDSVLVPNLGPVVFKYGYEEAVRDGIIARFVLVRVRVEFTAVEWEKYRELSEAISRLRQALRGRYRELRLAKGRRFFQVLGDLKRRFPEDARFEQFTAAAAARRGVVHSAAGKWHVVSTVAQVAGSRRVLCFHERIDSADAFLETVREAGVEAVVYHSALPSDTRARNLKLFQNGDASWLIACRSLDEGIDVPAVDTVMVIAGSRTSRQLIQRLGRALRRYSGKERASVVFVEVKGADEDTLDQEELADLRAAADELVDLDFETFAKWARNHWKDEAPAPPRRFPKASLTTRVKSVFRRLVGRERPPAVSTPRSYKSRDSEAWTGTYGNVSYYDKDSSPD